MVGSIHGGCEMRYHAANVFHQMRHVLENALINVLEDIANPNAGLVEADGERIVDVAAAIALRIAERAVQRKVGGEFAEEFEGRI